MTKEVKPFKFESSDPYYRTTELAEKLNEIIRLLNQTIKEKKQ